MKKFTAGLAVGVCIGFGLAAIFKPESKIPDIPEISQDELLKPNLKGRELSAENLKPKKMEQFGTKKANLVLEVSSAQDTPSDPKPEDPTTVANTLNIDISEQQITRMEEELPELQKDVSLYRDNKGWTVRFHRQDNLLSLTGINDNDLIRFEQIAQIKKDPAKTELISRLENIMLQLQH
jgi:hypothetical protein